MSPTFDRVIGRLTEMGRNPHPNGVGYKACCPAHDDDSPSLSITESDDGKILFRCHVGCKFPEIVKSMDMKEEDMFPPDPARAATSGKRAKKGDGWPSIKGVTEYLERQLTKDDAKRAVKKGKATAGGCWHYGDDFAVLRINFANGDKEFRPIFRVMGRWQLKVPPGKRPLYHQTELTAAAMVFVTEGEKCCDLVRALGLVATTSSSGASSAHKTDWSDLAGKTAYFLPDNDQAGEKYIDAVGAELAKLEPKPVIKVIRLHLQNEGDDIAEWLEDVVPDSWGPEECKAELERLAAASAGVDPKPAAPKPSPNEDDPIVNIRGQWVLLPSQFAVMAREGGLLPPKIRLTDSRHDSCRGATAR